jgi:hypothetical protein
VLVFCLCFFTPVDLLLRSFAYVGLFLPVFCAGWSLVPVDLLRRLIYCASLSLAQAICAVLYYNVEKNELAGLLKRCFLLQICPHVSAMDSRRRTSGKELFGNLASSFLSFFRNGTFRLAPLNKILLNVSILQVNTCYIKPGTLLVLMCQFNTPVPRWKICNKPSIDKGPD